MDLVDVPIAFKHQQHNSSFSWLQCKSYCWLRQHITVCGFCRLRDCRRHEQQQQQLLVTDERQLKCVGRAAFLPSTQREQADR